MGSIKNTRVVGNQFISGLLVALFIIVPFTGVSVPVAHALDIVETIDIANCTELQAIGNTETYNKKYQLTQNIDCSDTINWNAGAGFQPLNLYESRFDGQGYIISDLYIDNNTEDAGLFGAVEESIIENLVLENVVINGTYIYSNAGALAARLSDHAVVWNVHASGTVSKASAYQYSYVGGLVGRLGYDSGIYRSSFTGEVTRTGSGPSGGLAGYLESNARIEDSYADVILTGTQNTGGLAGTMEYRASIERSYAIGTLNASGYLAGGLVGYAYSYDNDTPTTITDSFAAITVSAGSAPGAVIGIAGQNVILTNVHYDATLAGELDCEADGALDGCFPQNVDSDGPTDPNYFYESTNEPLVQWDFEDVWIENDGAYPTLQDAPDIIGPGEIENLATIVHGNYIVFSWEAPTVIGTFPLNIGDRYEIEVKRAEDTWNDSIFSDQLSDSNYEDIYTEESPEWLIAGLEQDTTYDIRVRAYDRHVLTSDWVTVQATTGTPRDIEISSCLELQKIGHDINYTVIDNYTLTQNINCSDTINWNAGAGFKQIGDQRIHFWGTFDGAGYTISDLFIDRPDEYYVGLFGVVQSDASVSNLVIANAEIIGGDYVGILAGALTGTVTNATTTGVVQGEYYVGGLVGAHYDYIGIGNSSPLVYTWNGEKYVYVADVGQMIGRGTDGVDYATIDKENLVPRGDKYSLNISQEYNEIVYYDSVALMTYDHAPGYRVAQSLLRSADADDITTVNDTPTNPLQSCTDMYGNNCLNDLKDFDDKWSYKDRSFVNSWTMNFGDLSGADSIQLVLRAARDYAAESERDVRTVEVKDENGNWVVVYNRSQIGSDGTPRLRTLDLTNKFLSNDYSVRLTLNEYNVNYVGIDTSPQQPVTVNTYAPNKVDLSFRGYTAMDKTYFWDHDYARVSPFPEQPFAPQGGNFTKYGNVTALLQSVNDQYVIMRHGDHMSLEFPYVAPAEEGLERSFVLFNDVVYKHAKEQTGNAVNPLPFTGMTTYPYSSSESYPLTPENVEYLNTWNTRSYPIIETHSSTIYDSSSSATVTGDSDVGGLVGENEKNIYRSHATGAVTGNYYVGGLVGDSNYAEVIEQSYATGAVTGNNYVGGFTGELQGGTISESYATGIVTGDNYVGGFVGFVYENGSITNAYARGSVTGNDSVGGFVGNIDYGELENVYASGLVNSEEESVGGLIGYRSESNDNPVNSSFWDIETSGQELSSGGTGTTTLAMKSQSTFTTNLGEGSWDFVEIWGIDGDINNGYPYFLFGAPTEEEEEVDTYTLTYSAGSGGTITGSSTQVVESGASGTQVTAVANSGYRFVRWSDNNTNASRTDTNVTNTITVSAIFARNTTGGGGGTSAAVARNIVENTPAPTDNATLLTNLRAQLAQLMERLAQMTGETAAPITGVRDLEINSEGTDVRQLQQLLIAQGYTIQAGATGFFGTQTQAALAQYQRDNNITPAQGYFGEKTRAQMKAKGLTGLWW